MDEQTWAITIILLTKLWDKALNFMRDYEGRYPYVDFINFINYSDKYASTYDDPFVGFFSCGIDYKFLSDRMWEIGELANYSLF